MLPLSAADMDRYCQDADRWLLRLIRRTGHTQPLVLNRMGLSKLFIMMQINVNVGWRSRMNTITCDWYGQLMQSHNGGSKCHECIKTVILPQHTQSSRESMQTTYAQYLPFIMRRISRILSFAWLFEYILQNETGHRGILFYIFIFTAWFRQIPIVSYQLCRTALHHA